MHFQDSECTFVTREKKAKHPPTTNKQTNAFWTASLKFRTQMLKVKEALALCWLLPKTLKNQTLQHIKICHLLWTLACQKRLVCHCTPFINKAGKLYGT